MADWHSWRQADTASVTRIYTERGIDLLRPKYHDLSHLQSGVPNPEGWRFVEFPIFNAIHTTLVNAFPQYSLEIWGRLLSIFCSLLSIVFIFCLGKRFLGLNVGLIAAFLFAVLPYNIYFSRVILPEPLSVMLALASLYLFSLWYDTTKQKYLLLSAAAFSLALLVKPYTIFYSVPMLWLVYRKFDGNFAKVLAKRGLWLFAIISFAPFGLWRIWMTQFPEGIPYYTWAFNFMGIRFRPAFWRWIFGERLGDLILGTWGLFPFIIGLVKKPANTDAWFAHAFALGMFLYVSVIAAGNVRHDYYQSLIIPAIVLVTASGIVYLWQTREFLQPLTRIITVFAVGLALYLSYNDVKEYYQVNHPKIVRAGEALDKIAPKDALVVAPYNGDTAFLYQTKRSGWPIQTLPIEDLVKLGADYYVSVDINDPGTFDAIKKFEFAVEEEEYVILDLNRKRMPK